MAPSSEEAALALLAAMVIADAEPAPGLRPTVSTGKQRVLRAVLAERLPDRPATERQALLARGLRGLPRLQNGAVFLDLVRDRSATLAGSLDVEARLALMDQLLRLARGDDAVSAQELLVLRTVGDALGARVVADRAGVRIERES